MAEIKNTMECLDALISKMKTNGVAELEYSCEEFELKLSMTGSAPAPMMMNVAAASAPASAPAAAATESGHIVKSPIVGTFYAAAAPDKPPFVTVGQHVKKGDILMIIESMKLMNEIQSEFDGTVEEILVKSGDGVEFDQPLMRIV